MEGVASEAASLAGHLGLGRCVFLYDDNEITIDGPTDPLVLAARTSRSASRPTAGTRSPVEDGNDLEAIEAAIRAGIAEEERPTLIRLRTVIGYGSPRAGTRNAHSDPMPDEDGARDQGGARLGSGRAVPGPGRGLRALARRRASSAAPRCRRAWQARFDDVGRPRTRSSPPSGATRWAGRPRAGFAGVAAGVRGRRRDDLDPQGRAARSCRRSARSCRRWSAAPPTSSTRPSPRSTASPTSRAEHAGRNVAWGVREHGMGAAVNGLALHGGIVKPFCSTFFVFTDYMRPPIRLSSLMKLDAVWIFSHDSVAVGEDGPTHQPVEHLAAMRAIPSLTVIRPADANEAVRGVGRDPRGDQRPGLPRALAPERADRSTATRSRRPRGLRRGAYVLADADSPDVVLVATGAEVATALGARDLLAEKGVQARVVSMPSWELFEAQSARVPRRGPAGRRAEDLGRGRRRPSAGRAGSTPRSGSTRSAPRARAPRCSSTSGSAPSRSPTASSRRSPSWPSRSEGPRRLHPGRAGLGPGRDRDRRPARDVDDLPGVRVRLRERRLRRRGRGRARARAATASRSRASATTCGSRASTSATRRASSCDRRASARRRSC